MDQVGHLIELHEKYYDKGLRVLAISAEPASLLRSKMIEEKQANYWIASDPDRGTIGRFTQPGRVGIPHSYLVDANGVVVSDGMPSAQQIESLLENTFDPALGRELASPLKAAAKLYEKGRIGQAWAGAARYLEHEDRAVAADAAYLRERAEAYAAFRKKLIETGIANRQYGIVFDDLNATSKDFAGMEVATWAAAKEKELSADDAVATEMKAWKAYGKAQAKEEKAGGKEKKLGPVRKAYEKIVQKFPGSRAAEMAEKALQRLGN